MSLWSILFFPDLFSGSPRAYYATHLLSRGPMDLMCMLLPVRYARLALACRQEYLGLLYLLLLLNVSSDLLSWSPWGWCVCF